MLIVLLMMILLAVCFVGKELIGVHRQISSIRQFLEWTAIGSLENKNLRPEQREQIQKAKEDLIREGKLSKQQVDDMRPRGTR